MQFILVAVVIIFMMTFVMAEEGVKRDVLVSNQAQDPFARELNVFDEEDLMNSQDYDEEFE